MFTVNATVNSIFSKYATEYLNQFYANDYEKKIIRAISICRTEELGGRIEECDNCGTKVTLYNSCRNRHCPQCQFMKKEKWIIARKNEVLPFQYFHVVFTLPEKINPIVIRNKRIIYKLLFDATKETLLSISEDKKYFGARIGFFSILHTWGQKLNLHPHIHTVVPGGGYVESSGKWKKASKNYLVPVKVLSKRYRSIFLLALKDLHKSNDLKLDGTQFEDIRSFQKLIDDLFSIEWIVYIKESFKNSDSVIEYLSKYTHRIAISNHRIISCNNGIVRFSYKDYQDKNKKKILELPIMKFMKRFMNHTVPKRFVRIRYYGILSNSTKKINVENCREFFKVKSKVTEPKQWFEVYCNVTGTDLTRCTKCKIGKMKIVEVLSPVKMRAGPD